MKTREIHLLKLLKCRGEKIHDMVTENKISCRIRIKITIVLDAEFFFSKLSKIRPFYHTPVEINGA